MVIKGRNRDTAWYAMLDGEWPAVRAGFERWLAPANFDAEGRQRQRLSSSGRRRRAAVGLREVIFATTSGFAARRGTAASPHLRR